jgi:hypothetical protein
MRMLVRLAAAALLVTASASSLAQSQGEPSSTELKMAQDLVDEGRALGRQGRWGDALARFQKAAAVSRKTTPQLAFYVGYSEGRAGKLVAAQVDLRRAVEIARAAGNEQVVKAAQAELADLEARTPSVTVNASAGATALHIDGNALGVAALNGPIPLDPGPHDVVVRFAAGDVSRHIELAERQRATLVVDAPADAHRVLPPPLPAAPSVLAPVAPAQVRETTTTTDDGSGRRLLGLGVAGGGGAALVAGGVFYLLARSAIAPVTSACPSSPCVTPSGSPLPSDYQDAQNKQTIAIVLAAVGGVVAATGLVVFATAPKGGPPSVGLAPWLAPSAGGASLTARFE